MLLIGEDYIGFVVIFLQVFCRFKPSNIKEKNHTTFLDFSLRICTTRAFRINYLEVLNYSLIVYVCMLARLLQSCLTLCNHMDHSPPDSSVHGILQARILEWVARPSFRGSSQPRHQTSISYISCINRQVLYL